MSDERENMTARETYSKSLVRQGVFGPTHREMMADYDANPCVEIAVEYAHDTKGNRVDVHRPSAINPGDYEYVRVDEARRELRAGEKLAGPGGTCHHCGKAIVWRVFYKHVPTGNLVTFGYQCAGILDMTDNRIDHEMNLLKRTAANERREEAWTQQVQDRNDAFRTEHPELVKFLDEFEEDNSFINRIKWGVEKYGSPLDNQIESLKRFILGREKFLIQKQIQDKLLATAPLLKDGRQTIKGTVLSTKFQESDYGTTKKMRVQMDDGNTVFGTVPESIYDVEKDARVQFDAKVEPKEDHFGYYSRPTKAQMI